MEKKKFRLSVRVGFIALLALFVSCSEMSNYSSSSQEFDLGLNIVKGLTHRIDSTLKTTVTDNMTATLKVTETVDDEPTIVLYNNTEYPVFKAAGKVKKDDYVITEKQLNAKVTNKSIVRATEQKDGVSWEKDTIVFSLDDEQVFTIPVEISSYSATIRNSTVNFGTLTLKDADFVSLKNTAITPTKSDYKNSYNTEYKANLTLQEINVDSAKTFTVPVFAYAKRHIVKESSPDPEPDPEPDPDPKPNPDPDPDPEPTPDVYSVQGKNRVTLDSLSEKITFTLVKTPQNGSVQRADKQIILKHKFSANSVGAQTVSSFNYALERKGSIKKGTEKLVRTEGNFKIYGRTDTYSANMTDGSNKFATSYSLYHERCVYTEGTFNEDFGYESIRVTELGTSVTTSGSTATLTNKIQTSYIGYTQDLSQKITLRK